MATILKQTDARRDPKTGLAQGLCKATVGELAPGFTLAHNIMPPGYRIPTHSHTKVCRGTYVAKGRIRFYFGTPENPQIIDAEEGDYIYTPLGEIHSQMNLSDHDDAEDGSTYVGECDGTKLGTVDAEAIPDEALVAGR